LRENKDFMDVECDFSINQAKNSFKWHKWEIKKDHSARVLKDDLSWDSWIRTLMIVRFKMAAKKWSEKIKKIAEREKELKGQRLKEAVSRIKMIMSRANVTCE
jgi:hypothetical protein